MLDRTLGHRAPLLWLALPFAAGIAAGGAGLGLPIGLTLAGSLASALLAGWASLAAPRLWPAPLLAAMVLAGNAGYRLQIRLPPGWAGMPPRQARLLLRIDRAEPSPRRRAEGLGTVLSGVGRARGLAGQKVAFTLRLAPDQSPPPRGSVAAVAGLVGPAPAHLAGANFELRRGRLVGPARFASPYVRFRENLAERMNALLGVGLERRPDLAAIYRAMMLGRKADLSAAQKRQFLRSGTMHLFAINGLHIGMVALSFHALLALLRCPRPAAGVLVLAALWLDVDSTGATPSAVRAFLMAAVLESALIFRRPANPLAAVAVSAVPALLASPRDFFGASFRLSYSVVLAILTLGLPLAARLQARFQAYRDLPEAVWRPRQRLRAALQRHLLGALGVGLAAAAVSAVAGVEFFGVLSLVAVPVNLLVAPAALLAIVAGFCSVVLGLAGGAAASRLFNGAAGLLLYGIAAATRWAARLPGAWLAVRYRAPWIGPSASAALLAACLAGYALGWRRDRGGFWLPFALAAAALIFGVRWGAG